ncbi:MAG: GntR family transcriptional regulator [Gemmatimonadota bacterium]
MATPGRFRIDPDDPRPLYVQIMDEVRRAVVGGALRSDDAMPSVRELAGELRLNPNTVQQAYRELEREGTLYILRGRGSFVAPTVDRGALRGEVLRDLAERALEEAARAGVSPEELERAIRDAAQGSGGGDDPVQSQHRSSGRDVDG